MIFGIGHGHGHGHGGIIWGKGVFDLNCSTGLNFVNSQEFL